MPNRGWLRQFVSLAVMLFITAGLSAARQFDSGVSTLTSDYNTPATSADFFLQPTSASQCQLEAIGRQLSEPVDILSPLRNPHDSHITPSLPAVPAAITMTLCGFLCVSLVRDRRAWYTIVCGILWLSQAGIHAVPQLGHKLCCLVGATKHLTAKLDPTLAANSIERSGTVDTIRYIGLLRRLEGIPEYNLCSLQDTLCNLSFLRKLELINCNRRLTLVATGKYEIGSIQTRVLKDSIPLQAFSIQTNWPERLITCPARTAGNFIIFSPAFIFSNHSRGPPAHKARV